MPTNPYTPIVAGTTTGNTAASILNSSGTDSQVSVRTVTNIASAGTEIVFFNSNTRLLDLATGKYYQHNGTTWIEDTTTFPTFNTVYTKTQVDTTTNGITSTVNTKTDKVGSSTVDNFVSFSNTSGVQKDSGKNASSFIANDTILSASGSGVVVNDAGASTVPFRVESDTETNMIYVDPASEITYIGGTTNGVKITKGGEITLIGTATRFDDLRCEITVRSTGSKAPSFSLWMNGLGLYDFDDAGGGSEKEVFFAIQLPHGWKEGSIIYPHIHWTPKTAGSAGQLVRWGLEYTIAKPSGTFGASSTIFGETIVQGAITNANSHLITSIGTGIDMTGMTLSTMIVGRMFRNSSHANDTYGGIAGGLSFDIHYELDSFGSASDFTK